MPREFDDIADRRLVPQQVGKYGSRQPVNARGWIAPAQFVQHWYGVEDIPERRELDQQDSLEVAGRELLCLQGLKSSARQDVFRTINANTSDREGSKMAIPDVAPFIKH
jgi:hypothetical protein